MILKRRIKRGENKKDSLINCTTNIKKDRTYTLIVERFEGNKHLLPGGVNKNIKVSKKKYFHFLHTFNLDYISSSSSSCRAASTDIPDPLSSLLPIVHRLWQVFKATSCILTELLYVCSNWLSCFCSTICGGPLEYITYELVPASPAVSCMSGLSNLDSFRDGR